MFIPLPRKAHDLTGQRFDRLVALGPVEIVRYTGVTHLVWQCRCDCGAVANIKANRLKRGDTKSCGCRRVDVSRAMLTTHGDCSTPEYRTWCKIKERCHSPNDKKYADYGGRGIVVCERWLNSYESFLDDMGRRPSAKHSIDRVDNSGNYEPGNCRWATRIEQANNKRNNVWLEADGKRLTLAQWARETGIKVATIQARVNRNWKPEDIVTCAP